MVLSARSRGAVQTSPRPLDAPLGKRDSNLLGTAENADSVSVLLAQLKFSFFSK